MAQLYSAVLAVLCLSTKVLGDTIFFPDDEPKDNSKKEIPLEMVLRLNTITDENQLFRDFIESSDKPNNAPVGIEPDFISDRFGDLGTVKLMENVERKGAIIPKPAGCMPELRSVSLHDKKNDWEFYFPSCTRIEQCGGCCSHKLLSCQPVDVEPINYQVIVSEYKNGKLSYRGKEIVTVEKHNKCKCDCIMKEKDCNQLQEYRKGECRCVCTNKDAEYKCLKDHETKLWNPDSCLCECRSITECSTGTFFSQTSCSCEVIPETLLDSRFGSPQRYNYQIDDNQQKQSTRKWPPRYITE